MKRAAAAMMVLVMMIGTGVAFAANEKTESQPPVKTPSVKSEKDNASGNITGKVVETMNSGGYTYVCVENNGKKTWVAVPQMTATVGATMSFMPGAAMPNFTSKTLNRTFDSIVFSGGPASGASVVKNAPSGMSSGGSKVNVASLDKNIKVEKATGPSAYTVGEIYAKRASLDKKKVTVRGKVVKFSEGIMGRNWVHLQDGSGDQQKGTHNLVATSQDTAAVGDIVTVTGTFAKDKDFGAGYVYKAIIEEAKVQK